jgi:hypothetical protein
MNDTFLSEVLRLSNIFRAKNGLDPLVANIELEKAAQDHSESMAMEDFFSHTDKDGKQPWDRAEEAGYDFTAIAENIAAGQRSPEEVVNGWINSPGHRANLLNPNYTDLGVGYFKLDNDTGKVNYNTYWTQLFGSGDSSPATAPALPIITAETPTSSPSPTLASPSPANTPSKPPTSETPTSETLTSKPPTTDDLNSPDNGANNPVTDLEPVTDLGTTGQGTTDPKDASTDPIDAPIDPIDAPTEPIEAPTDASTDPINDPTDPIEAPTDAVVGKPAKSSTSPTQQNTSKDTSTDLIDAPAIDLPTDLPVESGTHHNAATKAQPTNNVNAMAEVPHSPDHAALEALIAGARPTHRAVKSGAWSNPSTWQNGRIPGKDANVMIGEGMSVTYDQVSETRIKTIAVEGNLKFATNKDTQLYVETILNSAEGKLDIGSATQSVAANNRARIIFTSDRAVNTQWDPTRMSKGLVSHGEVNIYGADKLDRIELVGDAKAGSSTLSFKSVPTGWRVGDKVVLGGTDYGWNGNDKDNSRLQDEVLTISSISGNSIKFTNDDIKTGNRGVLRFDHTRSPLATANETSLFAANLTRNVSFETENGKAVPIGNRAHVMLMHNPNVKVFNAGFYDLGRSDKTKLVDDVGKNVDGSIGRGTNVRGRYALHIHKAGDLSSNPNATAAILKGNAVSGSTSWGIVQHESRAGLEDNVVFDVAGAGIVAESGNEVGWWTNNTTIKSTGIDWRAAEAQRRAREGKFDLGFEGEGYWVQGAGMVKNKGNVAISANSTGMTLFGSVISENDVFRPVKTVPIAQLSPELQKLFPKGQTEVDIRDIPMATVEGFQAYNNTHGLQVWGHKTNFDGELAFSNNSRRDGSDKLPDTAHLGRSLVKDFKLWGSRWMGARVEYSSNIDLKNGLILGGKGGNGKVTGGSGLFSNHAAFNSVYDNLKIIGFKQGAQIEYPNTDKDFITTTLKNSKLSGNTYNLGAVGDEEMREGRPDDFGAFTKFLNNQFESPANNRAPVAKFGTKAAGGLAVTLDASASSDADPLTPAGSPRVLASKGISGYFWDLNNDGTPDRFGRTIDHVFDRAGSQQIGLTVLDSQGKATTVKQTINVQPSAYGNAFAGGTFDGNVATQLPWKSSSEYSDEGWYLTDGAKIANGYAQISKPGEWGGFIGQVTRNEKVHRGQQTLSFRMKNIEGAPKQNVWEKNEVKITLWGVNGQFANNPWEQTGPTKVGTLPMQRTALATKTFGGQTAPASDFFDWKNISMDVNLGSGYDYLMFQVNTAATRDVKDIVAIDNVSLSGAGKSATGRLADSSVLTPTPADQTMLAGEPTSTDPADVDSTLTDLPPTDPADVDSTLTDLPPTDPADVDSTLTDLPPTDPTDVDSPLTDLPPTDPADVDSPLVDSAAKPTDEPVPTTVLSFEEALGRIAKDTATEGPANNARLYGTEWVEGKVGGAIGFDGQRDRAVLKPSPTLNPGDMLAQRTLSMWFKADDVSTEKAQVVFEEGDRTAGINLYLEDDLLHFGNWSGGADGGRVSGEVESGEWHHAALVIDGAADSGTLTAYVDGAEVGQIDGVQLPELERISLGNVSRTTRFEKGSGGSGGNGLVGAIDEVKIFNDALNAGQVQQLAMV